MSKIKHCKICGIKKEITRHHLFPVRYLRYMPYYWHMSNNTIKICRKCHNKFEHFVEPWYLKIEDSYKKLPTHQELRQMNSRYKGAFNHHIHDKMKRIIDILENDRQRFKFVTLVRYQFVKFTKQRLGNQIISPPLKNRCDNSLKEYLGIK